MTAGELAVLAVLLAGPVPAGLARLEGLRRTPAAAMVLWQCVALAAVLAALGAGLALATQPVVWWTAVAALLVTLVVLARLLWIGHRVGTSLRSLRRHHREQLDLLAEESAGVSVLESEQPLAYCVPSVKSSRVVVSRAALESLSDEELSAVLAHERAHLRARHDLVLEAFSVLHRAFPRWVSSAAALREVRALVEVLADRAAARSVGPRPLGRALVTLAGGSTPSAALGVSTSSSSELVRRMELLGDPGPRRVQAAVVVMCGVGVVVLPTGLIVLPWLLSVWQMLG